MFMITAMIICVVFMLITAFIVLIRCEFYILSTVGILLVGLGGSKIFKDYAINVMRYIFAVAIKLMVLQMIVFIGLNFIKSLNIAQYIQPGSTGVYSALIVTIAASLLLLALAKTIPDTVGGIMNGSHINAGNPIAMAASNAARGAVSAVAGGAVGAAASINNVRLANQAVSAKNAATYAAGGTPASGFMNRVSSIRQEMSDAKMGTNPNSIPNQLKTQATNYRKIEADSRANNSSGGSGNQGGNSNSSSASGQAASGQASNSNLGSGSGSSGGANSSPSASNSKGPVDMTRPPSASTKK